MASISRGAVLGRIDTLFRHGTATNIPDTTLLERFLARGDAEAFEALVLRHGPMVLATCRAVLSDRDDAEDAFQATFIVLVKKAGTIRGKDALGAWLHRVALRVSLLANAEVARRRLHERVAAESRDECRGIGKSPHDRSLTLHEEVDRLPEKYRLPIVHCYLEGKTHAQAAAELRWGEATVRRRLADARELLRSRLTSRGLAPALAALTATTTHEASAAIPEPWLRSTVNAAFAMVASRGAATGIAAALAEAALKGMGTARLTFAGVTTLALGVAAAMGTGLVAAFAGDAPRPEMAQPAPKQDKGPVKDSPASGVIAMTYAGQVLDPGGKPVAGATLFSALPWRRWEIRSIPMATTDANGRFRLDFPARPKDEFPIDLPPRYFVAASAPGYGLGIADIGDTGKPDAVQLVEDLPLNGRIIDLEGRPVVGATIRPRTLWSPNDGDLSTRLRAYSRVEPPRAHEIPAVNGWVEGMIPPAVTGADGRFHIQGIGRERILTAIVEGPTIETAEITIMTRRTKSVRPMPQLEAPGGTPTLETPITFRISQSDVPQILGADSDFVAAPTHPVTGLVRDRKTGRPVAGVEVGTSNYHSSTHVKATTDQDGRYRLVGLPIGRKVELSAVAPADQPYFQANRSITLRPGESTTDVSFDLRRGIWIRGRAINGSTGRPISGEATYFPFEDNPHARKDDALDHLNLDRKRNASNTVDGSYRIVGLPGHGLVAFRSDRWVYAMGLGAKEVRGEKIYSDFKTLPHCDPRSYHNLAEVNPPDHVEEITQDLAADPGRSVTVRTLDAEGNLLSGIVVIEYPTPLGFHQTEASKVPEYVIRCLGPGETRTLTFWQQQRHLIARITVGDDQSGPITLKLQPWGVVTGRLPNTRGELGRGVYVNGMDRAIFHEDSGIGASIGEASFHADKNGRFRVEGLVPGTKYNLQASEKYGTESFLAKDVSLAPGETRELGDVHTDPKRETNR